MADRDEAMAMDKAQLIDLEMYLVLGDEAEYLRFRKKYALGDTSRSKISVYTGLCPFQPG